MQIYFDTKYMWPTCLSMQSLIILITTWRQSGLKRTSARIYITSGMGRENGVVFMYIILRRAGKEPVLIT